MAEASSKNAGATSREVAPEIQRKPWCVRCLRCQHVWPGAWLPMEADAAVRAMRAAASACPACGNRSKKPPHGIVMASQQEIDAAAERGWRPPDA